MRYFNIKSGKTLFAEWVPMEKVVINHEFNEKWTHDYIRIASFRNPIEKRTDVLIQCVPAEVEAVGKNGFSFRRVHFAGVQFYAGGYSRLTEKRLKEALNNSADLITDAWEKEKCPLFFGPKCLHELCEEIRKRY